MSILRETKWALLELFPEQKATEADAETAAREKHRADARAKIEAAAKAKAEAEAKARAKSEAQEGEEAAAAAAPRKPSKAEETAAESAAIDLAAKVKSEAARQAAPAEEPEEPESDEPPVSLEPEGARQHGVLVRSYPVRGYHLDVFCAPDQVTAAAELLDKAGYCLEAVTGVDWIKEEQMEVVYDYNRTDGQLCRVAVRTRVPRSAPAVPTISHIFPGANWHERETHEFFGIVFQGHPYLVPLLLPEDADFHPLLKDFTP
jgi:NADH-quinone oxidoreductase subunit C